MLRLWEMPVAIFMAASVVHADTCTSSGMLMINYYVMVMAKIDVVLLHAVSITGSPISKIDKSRWYFC